MTATEARLPATPAWLRKLHGLARSIVKHWGPAIRLVDSAAAAASSLWLES